MWSLSPIEFGDIPGWDIDDHGAALCAFALQLSKPVDEQYRIGSLGIDPDWFLPLIENAGSSEAHANPKQFFEVNFSAYRLTHAGGERGQVTGFYEPEVEARAQKSDTFQTPLLRRPKDLIALDKSNRPKGVDSSFRFGRKLPDGSIAEYYDRKAIQSGAIAHNDLAIAYVENPVDAFFIHIQGAARLVLEDGKRIRVTYDGKSGHPFTAIGKLLVERGEIEKSKISMQSIRHWLASHSDKATALMEENRSYIFFKKTEIADEKLGPIAAAKVPLSPRRSLAVDRLLHSFSTPIFVAADHVNQQHFRQLMIAQETGTAIVGPSRGDIFFGSGEAAGEAAGAVNSPCDFYLLVPRAAPFDHAKVQLQ